jgi:hypothetical protein
MAFGPPGTADKRPGNGTRTSPCPGGGGAPGRCAAEAAVPGLLALARQSACRVQTGVEPQQPRFIFAKDRTSLLDQVVELRGVIAVRPAIRGGRFSSKPGPRSARELTRRR